MPFAPVLMPQKHSPLFLKIISNDKHLFDSIYQFSVKEFLGNLTKIHQNLPFAMVFLYLTLMEYYNLAIIMSEEIEYLWEVSSTLLQKLRLIHAPI